MSAPGGESSVIVQPWSAETEAADNDAAGGSTSRKQLHSGSMSRLLLVTTCSCVSLWHASSFRSPREHHSCPRVFPFTAPRATRAIVVRLSFIEPMKCDLDVG